MPTESTNLPEQEHSIKARAHELYVEPPRPTVVKQIKPFPVYLRETPAEPFSPTMTLVLWIVGVIVFLLFLAALWRVAARHGPRHVPQVPAPAGDSAPLEPTSDGPSQPSSGAGAAE